MLSIQDHASINLLLNLIWLACVLYGLGVDYFEFSERSRLSYSVGLWTLSFFTQFKDVAAKFYTTFSDFDSFVCTKSQDDEIETICENVLNFRVAGDLLLGMNCLLIIGLLMSCLNLLMLLFNKDNWAERTRFSHYANPVIFFSACGGYLLVSNAQLVGVKQDLRSSSGVSLMFATSVIAFVTLTHYFYLRRYPNMQSLSSESGNGLELYQNRRAVDTEGCVEGMPPIHDQNLTISMLGRTVNLSPTDPLRLEASFTSKRSPGEIDQDKDAELAKMRDNMSQLKARLRKLELDKQEAQLIKREMEVYQAKYQNLRNSLRTSEGAVALIEQLEQQDKEILRLQRELHYARLSSPKSSSDVEKENDKLKEMLASLRKSIEVKGFLETTRQQDSVIDFSFRDSGSALSPKLVSVVVPKVTSQAQVSSTNDAHGFDSEFHEGISDVSSQRGPLDHHNHSKNPFSQQSQRLFEKQVELEVLKARHSTTKDNAIANQILALEIEVLEMQSAEGRLTPQLQLKLEKQQALQQLKSQSVIDKANRLQLGILEAQLEVIEASRAAETIEELEGMLDCFQIFDEADGTEAMVSKLVQEAAANTLADIIQARKASSPEENLQQKQLELQILQAAYSQAQFPALAKKIQAKEKELARRSDINKDTGLSLELSCSLSIPSALHSDAYSEMFKSQSVPNDTDQTIERLTDEVIDAFKGSDDIDVLHSLREQLLLQIRSSSKSSESHLGVLNKLKLKLETLKVDFREYPTSQKRAEIDFYQTLFDEVSNGQQIEVDALAVEIEELRKALNENDQHYSRELERMANELKAKNSDLNERQSKYDATYSELVRTREELRTLKRRGSEAAQTDTTIHKRHLQDLNATVDTATQAVDEAAAQEARDLQDKNRELKQVIWPEQQPTDLQETIERLQSQLDATTRCVVDLETDNQAQSLDLLRMEAELTEVLDRYELLNVKYCELQASKLPLKSFEESLAKEQQEHFEAQILQLTEERKALTEQLETAHVRSDMWENELKNLQDDLDSLRRAKAQLDHEASEAQAELKSAKDSQKLSEAEASRLKAINEAFSHELKLGEERLKSLETQYNQTLSEVRHKAEVELLKKTKEAEKIEGDIQGLMLKFAHLEATNQENTRLIARLNDANQALETDRVRLEDRVAKATEEAERERLTASKFEAELAQLKGDMKALKSQHESLELDNSSMKLTLEGLTVTHAEHEKDWTAAKNRLRQQLQTTEQELEAIRKAYSSGRQTSEIGCQQEDQQAAVHLPNEKDEEIRQLRQSLQTLEQKDDNSASHLSQLGNLRTALADKEQELLEAHKCILQLEDLLKSTEAGNLAANSDELERTKQELEVLKSDSETRLLKASRELVEARESKFKSISVIGEMQQQRTELAHKAKILEEELGIARSSIEVLEESLKKLQEQNSDREQAELRSSQDLLASSDSFSISILSDKISSLNLSLLERDKQLQRISKERDDLKAELESKQDELESAASDCIEFEKQLHELPSLSRKSNAFSDVGSEASAKEMVVLDNLTGVPLSHPLLDKVSSLKKEAPMTYSNVWKLFEALMQEKTKLDRLEISLRRQPRTMPEFMLDFLYMHYGLKTLALRQLKSLIASLEDLYRQDHPYGVLFCRFLGLFHPRPLAPQLSVFMVFIQEQFLILSQKLRPRRLENFVQQYELLQYGGQASILDVMELVVKLCKSNRDAGERIISQLLPDNSTNRLELILLKVCGTIARQGKDPRAIFDMLDQDQDGTLNYAEFTEGIRNALNVWVSQEEAEDLCSYLSDGTGEISFDSWSKKIRFAEYLEKAYTREALITKADFLNAIIDEYEYEVVQDFYSLQRLIPTTEFDAPMFLAVLQDLDPSIDVEEALRLWQEVLEVEPSSVVSADSCCIVILKHQIGGFGVGMFDLNALDKTLPKAATEGVNTDIVVERNTSGELRVGIRKKTT